LARNRYQLLGGLLIAIIMPALLRSGLELQPLSFGAMENTILGTSAAMLFGAYLRRRMTVYPGSGSVSVVLPAFGAAYGMAVFIFFFLRLEYSRFEFATSFVLVLLWFGFVSLVEPGIRRHRFLLIPFGKAENLLDNAAADWVTARSAKALPVGVTGVVADVNAGLAPEWEKLLSHAALSGLPVYHWKQIAESFTGSVDIEHISENNLGSLLPSSVYLRFKRMIDTIVVVITLPITLPIAVCAALAILICDGRPIFFRQTRVGYGGNPFTMLKFRTMHLGAEDGHLFTAKDDPRVTRLGRTLRHYRIDELPQIINILKGEMSWIGPRPEPFQVAEDYESKIGFYSYRHIVRPGITGWAQVHQGYAAEADEATTKLRYDFYYIKNFSPWLDLHITAKTVRIVLTGFGSR
jgi:lipopolysaccharide/colanic/teichoic acid biosynthesis glycosyltransferase